jgi:hypothetical protein
MVYNTQNYWVFGLFPSSGILENTTFRKLDLFPSSYGRRTPTQLGPSGQPLSDSHSYVCCTVVSARVYPRHHGIQVTTDSVCHCTILSNIYARYTEVSCQRRLVQQLMQLLWNCSYSAERSYAWPPLIFLCQDSPCPVPRTFGFTWFRINSARVLHNLVM